MDDRLDEILHRLRDLDDRLSRLEGRRGGRDDRGRDDRDCGPSRDARDRSQHDRHRGPGRDHRGERDHRGGRDGDGFDEKRVIDTIVRLVCENVGPVVSEAIARELDRRERRDEPDEPAGDDR